MSRENAPIIPWLDPEQPEFPDPERAMHEPDGLLAAGGALDVRFMCAAYSNGIFPWFSEGDPILWWSPRRRAVMEPREISISKSFSKTLRNKPWSVRLDHDFNAMVTLCSVLPREGQKGTWIVESMRDAYGAMHANGLAHSVEVFYEGEFCGGLFGVKLGGMFYGESMASTRADASKVALAHLCLGADPLGVELIDCQMMTEHLRSMGAKPISRPDLRERIATLTASARPESWSGALDGFDLRASLAARKVVELGHEGDLGSSALQGAPRRPGL